jgi:hypothetical protein
MPTTWREASLLLVIRRDRRQIYERAQQRFADIATVVLDRRQWDRRRERRPAAVERRSGLDRRQPLAEPDLWLWEHGGYYVAHSRAQFPAL